MQMATGKLSPKLAEELDRLALLPDDQIDTSDIPDALDWSSAVRGRYAKAGISSRDYDVRSLANWFISRAQTEGRHYTNLSLNKLVYLAFEASLVHRFVEFTPAKIEAWQYGPVFRELYQAFKKYGDSPVVELVQKFSAESRELVVATEPFLADDLSFLENIYEEFGRCSAGELVRISHKKGGAWHIVWNGLGKTHPGMEIERELILWMLERRLRDLNEQH
jgi:uncharacterized phage-associated protein